MMVNQFPEKIAHDFSSIYTINGNVAIQDAEIIVIADVPTSPLSMSNVLLLDHIWKEHLILVANVGFGKSVAAPYHDFTRGLQAKADIEGWDYDFNNKIEVFDEIEFKIQLLSRKILQEIKEGHFSAFFRQNGDCQSLLEIASSELKQEAQRIKKESYSLSNITLALRIQQLIYSIHQEFREEREDFHKTIFPIRQNYLKWALEKGLNSHKKAIICLDAYHVIPSPYLSDKCYDISDFRNYLRSKKHVVITLHHTPFASTNKPDLWGKNTPTNTPQSRESFEEDRNEIKDDKIDLQLNNKNKKTPFIKAKWMEVKGLLKELVHLNDKVKQ